MPQYIKHIDNVTNDDDFSRGYPVDADQFDTIYSDDTEKAVVGNSLRDYIKVHIYDYSGENLLGTTFVETTPTYDIKNYYFTDYNKETRSGTVKILDNIFPQIDENIIVSPTTELEKLNLSPGSYKLVFSFRSDVIGSYDELSSSLVIAEVSASRTEIKVQPECLKNSIRANDVAINNDYQHFISRQIIIAHNFKKINKLHTQNISRLFGNTNLDFNQDVKSLFDDYEEIIKVVFKKILGQNYENNSPSNFNTLFGIIGDLQEKISELYNNILLVNYNNAFSKNQFIAEYNRCIQFVISEEYRISSFIENEDVSLFFNSILFYLFNTQLLDEMFYDIFDSYFLGLFDLNTEEQFHILKYERFSQIISDPIKHESIILKLSKPLPPNVSVGQKFKIYRSISDDIIENAIFTEPQVSLTYKLRGPLTENYISKSGTKKYTAEDLEKTDQLTNSIVKYFNKISNNIPVKVDYSDFSKFVKFSSAKKKIDAFLVKMGKISALYWAKVELQNKIFTINSRNEKGIISDKIRNDSIDILNNFDISEVDKKITDIIVNFTDYDAYLFKVDSDYAWPRTKNIQVYLSEKKDNTFLNGFEGVYYEIGLFNEHPTFEHQAGLFYIYYDNENYILTNTKNQKKDKFLIIGNSFLNKKIITNNENSNGFDINLKMQFKKELVLENENKKYEAPIYMPKKVSEFNQQDSYFWYMDISEKATLYDKKNDDNLKNNIPEFLIRDESNQDFIEFLNLIGNHFDILYIYIENMGANLIPRNDETKGIPNQLVTFLLDSLGITFAGNDTNGEDQTPSYPSEFISLSRRKEIIYRRILNNLPHILKSSGTEKSLNALLRCYGVPDYLFKVKEFGGVKYTTDSDEDSVFSFDTFNYYLEFDKDNQFLSIPWYSDSYKSTSLEFSVKIDGTYSSKSFISDDSLIEYKVSNETGIVDGDVGITSSNWIYLGNIYFKRENVVSREPYAVDVFGPGGTMLGHITLTGIGVPSKLNYIPERGSYKDILLVGDIIDNQCFLSEESLDINFCNTDSLQKNGWIIGADVAIRRGEECFGYFYIMLNNEKTYIKDENNENPLLINNSGFYHFLVNKIENENKNESFLDINIKKVADGEEVLKINKIIPLNSELSDQFTKQDELFFGNNISSNFRGCVDKIRIYDQPIEESRFLNHILYSHGYDIDEPSALRDSLIVKVNFDYPLDLEGNFGESYGQLENNVFREDVPLYIKCHNFTKKEFPYNFSGENKRHYAKLPRFGSQTFNNNKIRVESQKIVGPLSPVRRSTEKSLDRKAVDTNTLGVYFSPTDLINTEIIRFFGNFQLADYIGDPSDLYESEYKRFTAFRKVFFKEGFGKIDWSYYLNLIKSYVDSSLFENVEKIVPARTRLISGLLVEQSLLERNKLKSIRINTKLTSELKRKTDEEIVIANDEVGLSEINKVEDDKIVRLESLNFKGWDRNKNIAKFSNLQGGIKANQSDSVICFNSIIPRIQHTHLENNLTEKYNFTGNSIGSILDEKLYYVYSKYGVFHDNGNLYKVEEYNQNLSYKNTFLNLDTDDEKYALDIIISITDFKIGETLVNYFCLANGQYNIYGSVNSYQAFTNKSFTWFIYFSNIKNKWVLINKNPLLYKEELGLLTPTDNLFWVCSNNFNCRDSKYPCEFSGNKNQKTAYFPDEFAGSRGSDSIVSSGQLPKTIIGNDRMLFIDTYGAPNDEGRVVGKVNCEIYGSFSGKFKEYTEIEGNIIVQPSSGFYEVEDYVFPKIKKQRHLFLDGKFTGVLKNGTVGSSDYEFRIIGSLNGEKFYDCKNPWRNPFDEDNKTILDINEIVSDNDTNFTSLSNNTKELVSKEFSSYNLVKIPTEIKKKSFDSVKYGTDTIPYDSFRVINSSQLAYKGQYDISGMYSYSLHHKTIDRFNYPTLLNYKISIDVDIVSNKIFELDILCSSTQSNLDYYSAYVYNANESKNNSISFQVKRNLNNNYEVDLLESGLNFKENKIYQYYGDVDSIDDQDSIYKFSNFQSTDSLTYNDIINGIYEKNYEEIVYNDLLIEKLKNNNNRKKCLIISTLDGIQTLIMIAYLDNKETFRLEGLSEDYSKNSQQCRISSSPLDKTNRNYYTRDDERVEWSVNPIRGFGGLLPTDKLTIKSIVGSNRTMYDSGIISYDLDKTERIIFTNDTINDLIEIKTENDMMEYQIDILTFNKDLTYNQTNNFSNYFSVIPKNEYDSITVSGFDGNLDRCNGDYVTLGQFNGKPLYVNEYDENKQLRINTFSDIKSFKQPTDVLWTGRKINYIFWSHINQRWILLHSNNYRIIFDKEESVYVKNNEKNYHDIFWIYGNEDGEVRFFNTEIGGDFAYVQESLTSLDTSQLVQYDEDEYLKIYSKSQNDFDTTDFGNTYIFRDTNKIKLFGFSGELIYANGLYQENRLTSGKKPAYYNGRGWHLFYNEKLFSWMLVQQNNLISVLNKNLNEKYTKLNLTEYYEDENSPTNWIINMSNSFDFSLNENNSFTTNQNTNFMFKVGGEYYEKSASLSSQIRQSGYAYIPNLESKSKLTYKASVSHFKSNLNDSVFVDLFSQENQKAIGNKFVIIPNKNHFDRFETDISAMDIDRLAWVVKVSRKRPKMPPGKMYELNTNADILVKINISQDDTNQLSVSEVVDNKKFISSIPSPFGIYTKYESSADGDVEIYFYNEKTGYKIYETLDNKTQNKIWKIEFKTSPNIYFFTKSPSLEVETIQIKLGYAKKSALEDPENKKINCDEYNQNLDYIFTKEGVGNVFYAELDENEHNYPNIFLTQNNIFDTNNKEIKYIRWGHFYDSDVSDDCYDLSLYPKCYYNIINNSVNKNGQISYCNILDKGTYTNGIGTELVLSINSNSDINSRFVGDYRQVSFREYKLFVKIDDPNKFIVEISNKSQNKTIEIYLVSEKKENDSYELTIDDLKTSQSKSPLKTFVSARSLNKSVLGKSKKFIRQLYIPFPGEYRLRNDWSEVAVVEIISSSSLLVKNCSIQSANGAYTSSGTLDNNDDFMIFSNSNNWVFKYIKSGESEGWILSDKHDTMSDYTFENIRRYRNNELTSYDSFLGIFYRFKNNLAENEEFSGANESQLLSSSSRAVDALTNYVNLDNSDYLTINYKLRLGEFNNIGTKSEIENEIFELNDLKTENIDYDEIECNYELSNSSTQNINFVPNVSKITGVEQDIIKSTINNSYEFNITPISSEQTNNYYSYLPLSITHDVNLYKAFNEHIHGRINLTYNGKSCYEDGVEVAGVKIQLSAPGLGDDNLKLEPLHFPDCNEECKLTNEDIRIPINSEQKTNTRFTYLIDDFENDIGIDSINYTLRLEVSAKQKNVVEFVNVHKKRFSKYFNYNFIDFYDSAKDITLDHLEIEYNTPSTFTYETLRPYSICDLIKIGKHNNIIENGVNYYNKSRFRRNIKGTGKNTMFTTIDNSGYVNYTSPIIRTHTTRGQSDSYDSFWSIEDVPAIIFSDNNKAEDAKVIPISADKLKTLEFSYTFESFETITPTPTPSPTPTTTPSSTGNTTPTPSLEINPTPTSTLGDNSTPTPTSHHNDDLNTPSPSPS
jgi:nitrogen regulatory protein PII-like uncharacterized protein